MSARGAQTARTILVTGAGGGLGAEMVRALLADGHSVAGVDADASALARLRENVGNNAERLKTLHADLADPEAGTRVQSQPGLDEIPLAAWDRSFAINVRASMLRPVIMSGPVRWQITGASDGFYGRAITAARWPSDVSGIDVAKAASRSVGWPELAGDAIWGASAQPNVSNGKSV